jgi:hypothetical protein
MMEKKRERGETERDRDERIEREGAILSFFICLYLNNKLLIDV